MISAGSRTEPAAEAATIRLGLIGDNIKRSRSPDLHRLAGRLTGLDVRYDLFIPRDIGGDFDAVFESCSAKGLRGVNITYPYKEIVAGKVEIDQPLLRAIGSINTVVFEGGRAFGHNTDHTGFIAAYRSAFGGRLPGRTAMIGAGGVGRAIAFGLAALGVEELVIVDKDMAKADHLAAVLREAGLAGANASADIATAVKGADGIVNCTPVGMIGYPGSPVPAELLGPQRWAFDAVYTPVDTLFKQQAEAAGLSVLSGYELFFHQGIQAFEIFTGRTPPDPAALRGLLSELISP